MFAKICHAILLNFTRASQIPVVAQSKVGRIRRLAESRVRIPRRVHVVRASFARSFATDTAMCPFRLRDLSQHDTGQLVALARSSALHAEERKDWAIRPTTTLLDQAQRCESIVVWLLRKRHVHTVNGGKREQEHNNKLSK